MTSFNIDVSEGFTAKVRGVDFPVDVSKLPAASLSKVFAYGLQRIFNDAAAGAKDDAEAVSFATKRYDNLVAGIIRSGGGGRSGDPVKRRAMELAEAAVAKAPAFIAAIQKQGWKQSDKKAVALRRAEAEKQLAKEGNPFTAQAKIDVEAAKGLDLGDMEISL